MPTSITLKGIPDHLYARLKAAAAAHHRSLNGEVIACLESVLTTHRTPAAEQLAAIRAIRERIGPAGFSPSDIDRAKRQGRA